MVIGIRCKKGSSCDQMCQNATGGVDYGALPLEEADKSRLVFGIHLVLPLIYNSASIEGWAVESNFVILGINVGRKNIAGGEDYVVCRMVLGPLSAAVINVKLLDETSSADLRRTVNVKFRCLLC